MTSKDYGGVALLLFQELALAAGAEALAPGYGGGRIFLDGMGQELLGEALGIRRQEALRIPMHGDPELQRDTFLDELQP